MRQIKFLVLLIVAPFLFCACPNNRDGHDYIAIINNSDKAISWQARFFHIEDKELDEPFNCRYGLGPFIEDKSSYMFDYDAGNVTWEAALNSYCLQILVMDFNTLGQYITAPCDTIRKYVPILHRYILTIEDLERMDWTVVYPPDSI